MSLTHTYNTNTCVCTHMHLSCAHHTHIHTYTSLAAFCNTHTHCPSPSFSPSHTQVMQPSHTFVSPLPPAFLLDNVSENDFGPARQHKWGGVIGLQFEFINTPSTISALRFIVTNLNSLLCITKMANQFAHELAARWCVQKVFDTWYFW